MRQRIEIDMIFHLFMDLWVVDVDHNDWISSNGSEGLFEACDQTKRLRELH